MMRSSDYLYTLIVTQTEQVSLGISQSLLLGIAVIAIFGIEVFATGFVAKRLDIFDANYGKALWAALLKNGISLALAYLFGRYISDAQRIPVLMIVGVIAPIIVYKLVFESTFAQAGLIWIAVLLVELLLGVALVYGALSIGASLDERFDLVTHPSGSTVAIAVVQAAALPGVTAARRIHPNHLQGGIDSCSSIS
ncbi:MAG: hypothetical protein JSW51_04600 [Gemmatimonadota bacterium]|nr:MAG: hypothetical protein JSW51_04600 [Gemmatimonadota bacterium]